MMRPGCRASLQCRANAWELKKGPVTFTFSSAEGSVDPSSVTTS